MGRNDLVWINTSNPKVLMLAYNAIEQIIKGASTETITTILNQMDNI
jgi:hypothetical protein